MNNELKEIKSVKDITNFFDQELFNQDEEVLCLHRDEIDKINQYLKTVKTIEVAMHEALTGPFFNPKK